MQRPSPERAIGIGLAVGGVAILMLLVVGLGSDLLDSHVSRPSTSPIAPGTVSTEPTASETPTATPSDPPSSVPDATPTAATATPTTAPRSTQLPTMLAAIGDSYTQAWSVSPSYKRDHPGYSWAVGTVKGDGVFSLRERFEALGDKITVVDVATSGRKMDDAGRQATLILAAAKKLPAGSTVYVTFELGTNDLCDNPATDPASFEAQLGDATAILRAGLPAGSRILMLAVPDFVHFHAITQADANARAMLGLRSHSQTCAPFLGSNSPLSAAAATSLLATYDATLDRLCADIEKADGPSDTLHCTSNGSLLAEKDFTIKDLSTVDYFHPSLSGQAKMAEAAWRAGFWSGLRLPSGAAAIAPAGPPGTGGLALAGLIVTSPAVLWRRRPRVARRRVAGRRQLPDRS